MRVARTPTPSPLLQNIHCSLPSLAQLYQGPQRAPFPPDPTTEAASDAVLDFFCRELGMGAVALRQWRQQLRTATERRWAPRGPAGEAKPVRVPGHGLFAPRVQDAVFVRQAQAHLQLLLSPLVTLCPPPGTAAAPRPTTAAASSRLYATQPLPAGMFVLSVPSEAALLVQPPPSDDPVLSYFMYMEDMIGQLLAAAEDPAAPHHHYVRYLQESIVPCRNLPFLREADLQALLPRPAAAAAEEEGAPPSPAWSLWSFYHEEMRAAPLTTYVQQRATGAAYKWWCSAVLSRREGAATLLPVVDKLNHSPLPNCHYTMASEASVCGLDVLDNLLAGVPGHLLYQPYVHVFTLRDVPAGEELTLCYSSAEEGYYKPAGETPPPRPASLSGSSSRAPPPEDLLAAYRELFPTQVDSEDAQQPQLRHRGPQEVATAEGKARWMLQWGFVPPNDAVFSAQDLRETAQLVAERRVDLRAELFPPTAGGRGAAPAAPAAAASPPPGDEGRG